MGLWRQVTHGLRALTRREESDEELTDEVRHFLEEAEADLVASGATREAASRAVRLQYGDGLSAREDVRLYGWEARVEDLASDVRLTARRLARAPGFTAIVVLILGLGIGSATAILSAVSPVLFEPLGYPDPDRVLEISDRAADGSPLPVAFGTYRELSERSRSFEALSVSKTWQPTLTGGDEPERLDGQQVSASYFDVVGLSPLGRGFDASADRPGGASEVILSDALWRARFGGDPTVVGRIISLDGAPHVVVGIMSRDFENVTSPAAQVWGLLQYDPGVVGFDTREWGHHLGMVGRLGAGVTLDDARRELDAIAQQPLPGFPRPAWASMALGLSAQRLRDAAMAGARPTSLVLLGAVGLLLAVACLNLTVLLLARGLRRSEELAVRAALGAGRERLMRQILTENLVLVGVGGAFGVVVADVALSALVAVSPPTMSRLGTVGVDGTTLATALALTTLVGVLVGAAPALVHSRQRTLRAGRRSTGGNRRLTRALVTVQVGFATMLLIGAGLLLRSTERLLSTPSGFDPESKVVLQVPSTGLEGGDAVTHRFWTQTLDVVREVPGVVSAGVTSQLPLSGDAEEYGIVVDGESQSDGTGGAIYRYGVSAGYLETIGIPLLEGRTLAPTDGPDAPRVAVVSASLARRLFPDRSPLGRDIRVGPVELAPFTIVGVVDDVKQESLEMERADAVYVTSEQWHWADRIRWIVVEAAGDPLGVVASLRRAVWSVDADQPIVRVQSLEDLVLRSEARRRFVSRLMAAFAFFALLLSALGLYGVLSGSVAERRREIGVRGALGAPRGKILELIVRQGMTLAAVGAMAGVLGAAAASEILATFMYGVSRLDPPTYIGAVVLLALTCSVACWLPAYRASRVDPLTTFRVE